jgi:hypothetical protein
MPFRDDTYKTIGFQSVVVARKFPSPVEKPAT